MAKFSYYLDFMMQFIDEPVDELIKHNGNGVRDYRVMSTKVLLLNSSSEATSQRASKVAIDREVAEALIDSDVWKKRPSDDKEVYRVCLIHHPPSRSFDYVEDRYEYIVDETGKDTDDSKYWAWEEKAETADETSGTPNYLFKQMRSTIEKLSPVIKGQKTLTVRDFDAETDLNQFIDFFNQENGKNRINFWTDLGYRNKKTYFVEDAKRIKELIDEVKKAAQNGEIKSEDFWQNETGVRLINSISHDIDTTEKDQQYFDDFIKNWHEKEKRFPHVFLSGHVHANNYDKKCTLYVAGSLTGTSKKKLEDCVFIINKLMGNAKSPEFYILSAVPHKKKVKMLFTSHYRTPKN